MTITTRPQRSFVFSEIPCPLTIRKMDGILSVKIIRSLACTVLAGELAVRVTLLDVRLFSYDRYTLIVDRVVELFFEIRITACGHLY